MSEDHEKKSVREILARIEATMEAQIKATELYTEQMVERVDNHGRRLGSLEATRTWVTGLLAGAVPVAAVIWHKLQDKVRIGH